MSQDFVLRLIQQVAQMLASVLAARKAGRTEEAKQAIEKQCFRTTGLPYLLVKNSSLSELLTMMDSGPQGLRCSRKIMLAELLLQDAEIDEAAGNIAASQHSEELAAGLLAASLGSLSQDEARAYQAKLELIQTKLQGRVPAA